jgi:hypothetical protein
MIATNVPAVAANDIFEGVKSYFNEDSTMSGRLIVKWTMF